MRFTAAAFKHNGRAGAERRAALAAHEYGHTLQSLLLGPLYLLTIGVISFTWANAPRFKRMRRERGLPYSHCIVERWADRLGGIRDQK